MSETKTYVFPEGGQSGGSLMGVLASMMQSKGLDPNLLLAMNRGGSGFGGEGGWFIWVIFLFFLMGWGNRGWGGFGGNSGGGIANEINNDYGRGLLLQAINGNGQAIGQLATNLNCSVGQIQNAINAMSQQVQQVGCQVGMTGQQVINAIQSGNASLGSQLASCCCDIRNSITTQGYENQLRISEQTNVLGGKIDGQTALINDRFCQLEMREMQNKIDSLREENSTLKGNINNAQQTAAIQGYVASAVNPVASALNALQNDVNGIKCKLPESVNVPYSPVTAIPNCVAYGMGIYGGYPYGLSPVWG